MDPKCVNLKNCQVEDISWKDGGPNIDKALYDGWLKHNIDEGDQSCLQVWKSQENASEPRYWHL